MIVSTNSATANGLGVTTMDNDDYFDQLATTDDYLLEEALERLTESQYIDWLRGRHFHAAADLWEAEFARQRKERATE